MMSIDEDKLQFIKRFSSSEISNYKLYNERELNKYSKFLDNDISLKYIGHIFKNINLKLYLNLEMMINNNKIEFIDNYNVKESLCLSSISCDGVSKDVKVCVPNICNGFDMFALSHELAHGVKTFSKLNNERKLNYLSFYEESCSILFGRLCEEKYIYDFGYDDYVIEFEKVNINNAIKCLKNLQKLLQEYNELENNILNFNNSKLNSSDFNDKNSWYSLNNNLEQSVNKIYKYISYPIGIALLNNYLNMDNQLKKSYLLNISKFILNTRDFKFEDVLFLYGITSDVDFYINNFEEYIDRFNSKKDRNLILRR